MTTLPKDNDNNAIQALRLHPNGAHTLSASSTATRNVNAFSETTRIVSVYATGPVYMQFGESDVVANNTNHYFPDGLYYDFAIGGDKTLQYTHLSVIAAAANCSVHLSEKQ